MANRFWVGTSGTWDATVGTKWSATSNGTGGASVPTVADDVFFDAATGVVTIALSATSTCKSLTCTGFTGTLNHVAGVTFVVAGAVTLVSTMTYTVGSASTSILNITASSVFTPDGKTIGSLLSTAPTLQLAGNLTLTSGGSLTINGTSPTPASIISNTIGTSRTITNTGVTMGGTFLAFRDIALSTAWDASAVTGGSSDRDGNTNITFTAPAVQFWVGGTGSWNESAHWASTSGGAGGSGRVPLVQDSAKFDANSFSGAGQTVTQTPGTTCRDIDWTGATNSPTYNLTTVATVFYGNVKLISGMTFSTTGNSQTYSGRRVGILTSAGKSYTGTNFLISAPGGTCKAGDALTATNLTVAYGTYDDGGFTTNTSVVNLSSVTTTRAVTLTGTMNVNGTTGVIWANSALSVNLTLTLTGSTIVLTSVGATAKTFQGADMTYGNITVQGDNITIQGNNTFQVMSVNNAALTNGLKINAGSTQTVSDLTTNGSVGNLAKILSTSASTYTISSTNPVDLDYISIGQMTAAGSTPFYAGDNSTDAGSNTGVTFTARPSGGATAVTLSGPASGVVNTPSTNFTVGANGTITGTVIFTPTSSSGSGSFTPTTVSISSGSPTGTFTFTPTSTGLRQINGTNNGSLTAPANVAYTATSATVSAALTGTAVTGMTEANVVSGGRTIVITLTGDTWIA